MPCSPHTGDRVAWPTSLGWMMGPWLMYATLLNGATLALYEGAPTGRDFGAFLASAQVSVLGLVPSIVKAWRASECMKGLEWPSLRVLSSTGEASSPGGGRGGDSRKSPAMTNGHGASAAATVGFSPTNFLLLLVAGGKLGARWN